MKLIRRATIYLIILFLLTPFKISRAENNLFSDIGNKFKSDLARDFERSLERKFNQSRQTPLQRIRGGFRDLEHTADDIEDIVDIVDDIDNTLYRIDRKTSEVGNLNEDADRELRKIREAKSLQHKLERIEQEKGDLTINPGGQIGHFSYDGELYNNQENLLARETQDEEEIIQDTGLSAEEIARIKIEAVEFKENNAGANTDLSIYEIDGEIGGRFDAESVTNGDVAQHFDFLLFLLEKNIIPSGEVQPVLQASNSPKRGVGSVDKKGSFIILGSSDSNIEESGIRYVIVNDVFYNAIDNLEKAFPQVEFIRANKANQRLTEIIKVKN